MFVIFSLLACQDAEQASPTVKPESPKAVPATPTKNNVGGAPQAKAPVPTTLLGCTYTIKEAKPEWTAYKYTEKAAVGGTFTKFTLSEAKSAPSFVGAMNELSIEIDASSVESNNPARNKTIAEKYFSLFAPQSVIKGNVLNAKGNEKKGTIAINIDMNGVQKPYSFSYEEKDGVIIASSVMDMMDFQLQKPFDSIHTACKTLHTGKDGVAKTWTEVALRVVVQYEKVCQ